MSEKSQNSLKSASVDGAAANGQARNWTFLVYPDSAPNDWRDILDDLHLEWVESPIHDKDINGDGSPKKPHIHIGVFFDGKKSYEQVESITKRLNAPIPKRVHNIKSLIRYFAHMDNPDKVQYRVAEIVAHGGFDVRNALTPSSAERYEIIRDMMNFCAENDIFEFSDLAQYAMDNHFDTWFPVLTDHNTIVMQTYLTSRRHKYGHTHYDGQLDE